MKMTNKYWLWAVLSVLLLALSGQVFAASFDCVKAATDIEKMICGNPSLSQQDAELGQNYQAVLEQSRYPGNLKSAQRQWLKERNQCRTVACLNDAYQQRQVVLQDQLLKIQYSGQPLKITSALEQTYDNASALVVRFSVPIEKKSDFKQFFQLKGNGETQNQDNWILSEDGLLAIFPFVEPQTEYLLTVNPGLLAINRAKQVDQFSKKITTRRKEPSAAFAGSGAVMSSKLKRALPVTTLNVDAVDVDIFRIDPQAIPAWSYFNTSKQREYYELTSFTKENPLVYSGRFDIEQRRNQRGTQNLDLSAVSALDEPGAYLAVLRVAGRYTYSYDTSFFTVSDIGLQVRRHREHLVVFCRSISDGTDLDDVEISLYQENKLVAQVVTDDNGSAEFNGWYEDNTILVARQGDQTSILRFDQPLDLSGIRNATSRHLARQVFAWGPRNLYRPGERVTSYALLRDYDGRQVRAIPLRVELIDGSGNSLETLTVNAGNEGSYQVTYDLPKDAKTGTWKLVYREPGQDTIIHEYKFAVEDFLPERMSLQLLDGKDDVQHPVYGDGMVTLPVQGDYLYGAPAAGNKADGFIGVELERHPFEQWSTFSFGIADERIDRTRLTLNELALDSQGQGRWQVELANWKNVTSPLALTVTASLYESGGRPVTRSSTVTRIKGERLIGIEPQFSEHPENDSRPEFKLIATDNKGALLADKGYRYTLVREDRNYYWTYDENSGWEWHYDPMEYEVFSGQLQFDGAQATRIATPVQWGNYRLEVYSAKNQLISSYRFRTSWYWWGNSAEGSGLKPDQVRMTFREGSYQQGQPAHLLLTPPTDGLATITVESNDEILWISQQQVAAAGNEIEIPVAADWFRHDIYVTATVLAPGDMQHSVAPKRAFGFVNLPLKRKDADLSLSIEAPERIESGRDVEARVLIAAAGGLPDNLYVTLAAVDIGVLNITRYKTPDPGAYFYAPRRYDVDYYDIYGRIIENAGYDYIQQRFGGDFVESDAELARGGKQPDNDVKIMSWQSPPVKVAADGTAVFTMPVPEFNGRVRWMAVAYADQAYGAAQAETRVADKVVVQLSKPRFLALGDKAEISLDVSNQSDGPLDLSINLKAGGVLLAESFQQQLALTDKAKQTLKFTVTASASGRGTLGLQVRSDNDKQPVELERDWFIDIRSAYPAVTRKEQAIIEPGSSWKPGVKLTDLTTESVQGRLVLSLQPPIDVSSHFHALLHYPYGCTEQSTSSGYPWVLVTPEGARSMGLLAEIEQQFKQPYNDQFRKQQIEKAVARLLSRQVTSGGFGYWSADEENYWLTAYVSDFLTDAQLAGVQVPATVLKKALARLQGYVKGTVSVGYRYSSDKDYYRLATRSYAAYVLAKVKQLSLSDLRRFHDQVKSQDLSYSMLPWVQLAYAFETSGDSKRATQCYEKVAAQPVTEERYYGTYGSSLRDLALSYAIMARAGHADGQLLLELFAKTRERSWLSTQERNALFRAAVAAGQSEGEQLDALIATAGKEQLISRNSDFKALLSASQLTGLESVKAQGKQLYGMLEVIGEYRQPPEAYSNGLHISRDFFDLDGRPLMLDQLNSGDLVIVRLTAGADKATPDALLVDLLPAGLELENQNLGGSSVDLSRLSIAGKNLAEWQQEAAVSHLEYRDDRFVVALPLSEYKNSIVYYLARAVTPGTYSVPPSYVEDMYRPERQAVGSTPQRLQIMP